MSENTTGGYFIYIIIPILSGFLFATAYKLRLCPASFRDGFNYIKFMYIHH